MINDNGYPLDIITESDNAETIPAIIYTDGTCPYCSNAKLKLYELSTYKNSTAKIKYYCESCGHEIPIQYDCDNETYHPLTDHTIHNFIVLMRTEDCLANEIFRLRAPSAYRKHYKSIHIK